MAGRFPGAEGKQPVHQTGAGWGSYCSAVPIVQLAGSLVDLDSGRVRRLGCDGSLSPLQLRLLRVLVERSGQDLDRALLRDEVGFGSDSDRAVDAAVRSLRKGVERDPSQPDHVQTVHGTGYRFNSSVGSSGPDSLPRQWDQFVGRGKELFALGAAFLEGAGLVTLHGPAGVGKTRLSLRFGETAPVHGLDEGVLLVELADAGDEASLCDRVAAALDLPLAGPLDPVLRIGRALGAGRRATLVILDNGEQLVDVLAEALATWMAEAPSVRWLVTSQKPVGLDGERLLTVPPLGPGEAVRLFEERARAQGAGSSQLDQQLMGSVCRRVEGLPLAVELAAARVPVLGLDGLDAALSSSFGLLSRPGWEGEERHRTLHAAISWSWSLLDESGREALSYCSVFRGGFSPAAAHRVLDDSEPGPRLEALVAASLLVREEGHRAEPVRYKLGLPVRELAARQLDDSGLGPAVAERHRLWCMDLVMSLGGQLWASGSRGATDQLMAELPNLLAAHRSFVRHDPVAALSMVLSMQPSLRIRSSLQQQSELLSTSLEAAGESAPAGLRSLALAAWASVCSDRGGQEEAWAAFAEARRLAAESGDPATLGWVLMRDGLLSARTGEAEQAERALAQARELSRRAGQADLEAEVCTVFGIVRENQGRLAEAEELLEEALGLARAAGHPRALAAALGNLGIVAGRRGDGDAAKEFRSQAIAAYRAIDSRAHLATMLVNQGVAAVQAGDAEAAVSYSREAIEACRRLGNADGEAIATSNLALAELELGHSEQAEAGFRSAIDQLRRLGRPREEGFAHMGLGLLLQVRGSLPDADSQLHHSITLFEQHGDRIAVVLVRGLLAIVRLERGQVEDARALFEKARSGAEEQTSDELLRAVESLLPVFGFEQESAPGNSHYERVAGAAVAAFRART